MALRSLVSAGAFLLLVTPRVLADPWTPLTTCLCDESRQQDWVTPLPGSTSGDLEIRDFLSGTQCWEVRVENCAWNGMCIGLGECTGTAWNVTLDENDDNLLQIALIPGSGRAVPDDGRQYCVDQARDTGRIEVYVSGRGVMRVRTMLYHSPASRTSLAERFLNSSHPPSHCASRPAISLATRKRTTGSSCGAPCTVLKARVLFRMTGARTRRNAFASTLPPLTCLTLRPRPHLRPRRRQLLRPRPHRRRQPRPQRVLALRRCHPRRRPRARPLLHPL